MIVSKKSEFWSCVISRWEVFVLVLFFGSVLLLLIMTIGSVGLLNWNIYSAGLAAGNNISAEFVGNEFRQILNDHLSINLSLFAIFVAFATLMPFLSAKLIANRKMEDAVEQKINDYFSGYYDKKIVDVLNGLYTSNADHSRMTATMLYYKGCFFWSLGWMARAVLLYSRGDSRNKSKYLKIIKSCYPLEVDCIKNASRSIFKSTKGHTNEIGLFFKKENQESPFEEVEEIVLRTLTSLIDQEISIEGIRKEFDVGEQCVADVDRFIRLLLYVLVSEERNWDKGKLNVLKRINSNSFHKNMKELKDHVENHYMALEFYYDFEKELNALCKWS